MGVVSLKSYWKRNGYTKLDRLDQENKKKRKIHVAKLGDGTNRRRFWRFKVMKKKLKVFKMGSVKKFFVKLRDTYVNMMLGLANSRVLGGGYGYGGGGVYGGSSDGFGIRPMKEYDEKMIVEIYKSILLAQSKIAQGDAEKPAHDLVVANHQGQNLVK